MTLNEKLIKEYAKKIYGFSFAKTHNYHDAWDLSQNILLQLCKIDFTSKSIADMNGYIYRVCQYSWSNYVRSEKQFRESSCALGELQFSCESEDIVSRITDGELYQKLYREIMYLGKTKREVTIMFYFENLSGKEIAKKLEIPPATVRWHLGESKKRLKERMSMTDVPYRPKRLSIYFRGTYSNGNGLEMAGLRDDLLVQNICIACEKKPLRIEEISAKLGMAAAYIENKMDGLIYMNYVSKVGSNKYKTTFFIKDAEFYIAKKKFEAEHLPPIANAVYSAVKKYTEDIRNIGFCGSELNENFLLWDIIPSIAHNYLMKHQLPLNEEPPMRGDGSRHWIMASWQADEVFDYCHDIDKDFKEYMLNSEGYGAKHFGNENCAIEQFDPPAVTGYRRRSDVYEIEGLRRVHSVIKQSIPLNEHDKEIVSLLAEKGYVTVKDGKPSIMIPFFTLDEYKAFREITDNRILTEVETAVGTDIAYRYAEYIKKYIPSYVSETEKAFLMSDFYCPNAFTYLLYKCGSLALPSEREQKIISTIALEKHS